MKMENNNQNNSQNKYIYSREEIIDYLIKEYESFFKNLINRSDINIDARIKNGPSQLTMYGLYPYITFLISKYNIEKDDNEGYSIFLNFIIYILIKYYKYLFPNDKIDIINKIENNFNELISNRSDKSDRSKDRPDRSKDISNRSEIINNFVLLLASLAEDKIRSKILYEQLLIILEEMKKIYIPLIKAIKSKNQSDKNE